MRRVKRNDGRRGRILVVDDHEEVLTSTRQLLEGFGHEVLTAARPELAIGMLKEHAVDVILVDYFMPRMNGGEFVRQLRTFDPDVQVVLQTAYSGEKPPKQMMAELDICGYHDKADGPDRLLLWIASSLNAQARLRRARAAERQLVAPARWDTTQVLLVGRDASALAGYGAVLRAGGFQVLDAAGVDEATDVYAAHQPPLLVIDAALLDAAGREFLRRVRYQRPGTAVVALGAALDPAAAAALIGELDLHAVHDTAASTDGLLEPVASAAAAARRLARAVAGHDARAVVLTKLCHDLRANLQVVHGYAEVLRGELASGAERPMLDRLLAASSDASELLQEYLDLNHLESGAVTVRRELVGVRSLVEDVCREAAERQPGHPVAVVDPLPPDASLVADGEKLRIILRQLVATLARLCAGGPLELRLERNGATLAFVLTGRRPDLTADDQRELAARPHAPWDGGAWDGAPAQELSLVVAGRLSELLGFELAAALEGDDGLTFRLCVPAGRATPADDAAAPTVH